MNREIVPDGVDLMICPSFMWGDGYRIGMGRFFNRDGAQVMTLLRGARNDLT